MHPNRSFHWTDRDAMAAMVRDVAFGTLFAHTPDGPRVVHVPAVLDGDVLTVHIARGNAMTRHLDGLNALFVVNGPDAYISPDWYQAGANEVPTWDYVAIELEGRVRRLSSEQLTAQLVALSAQEEARLAPKTPWTLDKVDPGYAAKLQTAIVGFAMDITAWRGTLKVSQNKPEDVRSRVADALEARGRRAMAHLVRSVTP